MKIVGSIIILTILEDSQSYGSVHDCFPKESYTTRRSSRFPCTNYRFKQFDFKHSCANGAIRAFRFSRSNTQRAIKFPTENEQYFHEYTEPPRVA